MKRETEGTPVADRRSVLKLAGAGVVTGGAALVAGAGVVEAATAEPPAEGQIYRETEHVKRFYELAKSM